MKRSLHTVRSLRRMGANGLNLKLLWGLLDISLSFEDTAEEPESEQKESIGFQVSAPDEGD